MDADSDDSVAPPFLLDASAPSPIPATPWVAAAAVHVAAGLALWAFSAVGEPPAPVAPPPEIMTVTLVEPPRRPPASVGAASADEALTDPVEPALPATFDVGVASAALERLTLPDFLRVEEPDAALGAPSDTVREALARSLRCRDASEREQAECPVASEDYAVLAELQGVTSELFLDAALAPRGGAGPPDLWIGPVASTLSLESVEGLGGSEPAIMLRSRVTLPPRGSGPDYAASV